MTRVVIATDGSEAALDAARRSIDLFREDAEVMVLMAIPQREDPMDDAGGFEGPLMTEDEAQARWEQSQATGRAALEHTAEETGPGVEVRLITGDDRPGATIVKTAHELAADVLVVGSGGKGALKRLLGGSVSDYVVHHAPCPVLLVRHDH